MIRPGIRRLLRLPGRPGRVEERELEEEIRQHLELRIAQLEAEGMGKEEARAEALRRFGSLDEARRTLRRAAQRREKRVRRSGWLDVLRQDARYGWRQLVRNPAFAAISVLTLALGIGATVATFTVLNGVLLRPLPYPHPERLTLLWTTAPDAPDGLPSSAATFLEVRDRAQAFTGMAALRAWSRPLSDGETSEMVDGARVSPALFPVLGVRPLLGRTFLPEEEREGAERVMVLSHALWQRRYGGDPGVLGRRVTLGGERYTVVGVMPAGFSFPRGGELPAWTQIGARTELWVPLRFSAQEVQSGTQNLVVVGRLREGVSLRAAQADLAGAARGMADEFPGFGDRFSFRAVPMGAAAVEAVRPRLWLLFGVAGFVLLIACANVAGLLVARSLARQREMAIRGAVGASGGRLARQLVTESLLLSLAGATLGVLATLVIVRLAVRFLPADLPRLDDIAVDARVLGLAVLVTLSAGIALGCIAAVYLVRVRITDALQGGVKATVGVRQHHLRSALVTAQVALSLVLLVGAGLLGMSYYRLEQTSPGFEPEGVLSAGLSVATGQGFDVQRDGRRWVASLSGFVERAAALPGVRGVGGVSALPLTGIVEYNGFQIDGRPRPGEGEEGPSSTYAVVAGDYFRVMEIPLRQGRVFTPADREDAPLVVVINEALARKYFPGESPIGKRVRLGAFQQVPREIVGVVGDVRQTTLEAEAPPAVYLPLQQAPYPFLSIVVRTAGPPDQLAGALRRELRAVNPAFALADIRSLPEVLAAALAQRRFIAALVGTGALTALVLAIIGLYGGIAFAVGERKREIGVRMALGARPSDAVLLILRQGVRIIALGVGLGMIAALGVTRLLRSQLVGVTSTEPAVYLGVLALVLVVGLIACYLPARRTSRVDPMQALRVD
jgi:putative ABC transport system permease protein